MSATLPRSLEASFLVASAELGMCSAAWIIAREVAAAGGDVERLRDELGRTFPVLDAVAREWLDGSRGPPLAVEPIRAACEGADRVLVTGLEAAFVDALLDVLPAARLGIVEHAAFEADWARVRANWGGRVDGVDLASFERWAGRRSVLLAFVYGTRPHATHVSPASLRVLSPHVRTQFRDVVAWNVLRGPMFVYPRWLADVPRDLFSVHA